MSRADVYFASVPASSANLGPGFDAVGLALNARISAHVEPAAAFSLAFRDGPQAPTHDGIAAALRAAMLRVMERLPAVRICIDNRIPLGKGLGSSAAARVLGLMIAWRTLRGRISRSRLAQLACELEGHPENALAAIYGGAIIATASRRTEHVRIAAPQGLHPFVVIPDIALATEDARQLLPERYSRADVIFTAQHCALLGAALASSSWGTLRAAMRDRMHQPYRAAAIPGMREALALRDRALIGVALSGAGPGLLAFVSNSARVPAIAARLLACFAQAGIPAYALPLATTDRGAQFKRVA